MRVLALNGSPRANGNTNAMLRCALAQLDAQGIETELVQIGTRTIRPCLACGQCRANLDRRCAQTGDDVNDLIEKMISSDGVLLGSPTYFASITPPMKALIDRAGLVVKVNGDLLARKVGAGVVAKRRGGAMQAFNTLNAFFLIGQMIIPGSCYWNMGVGGDEGEVANDEEGMRTMTVLGRNMAWLLERLHA
jgi:multimeric flavodoxin WrbA